MSETTRLSIRIPVPGAVASATRASVLHHRWLLAVVFAYLAAVMLALESLGRPYQLVNWMYLVSAAMPVICWTAFLFLGSVLQSVSESRSLRWEKIVAAFRSSNFFTVQRSAHIAIPLILLPLFSSAFSSYKSAITAIEPFWLDVSLWQLDRWLHFGTDPWRLLQPILGTPAVTSAISYLYNLWFPLLYVFMYVMIFKAGDLQLRMRYLLTFASLWIVVGSLMATGLSSAGPCYFDLVTGQPSPYAPLMAYLREANESFRVWALDGQAYLWDAYSSAELATGGGISAMPSMHVAIAVLQGLAGWQLDKRLGAILGAYALVIMAGSVHLGWHYAVDGYVSAVCALLLWLAAGRFVGRRIGHGVSLSCLSSKNS